MGRGKDFEEWFCYELPWKLRLSPSKQVAMHKEFGKFTDYVYPLAEKVPEEFDRFLTELKNRIESVYRFRAPKGTMVAWSGELYPNKRPSYGLFEINSRRRII